MHIITYSHAYGNFAVPGDILVPVIDLLNTTQFKLKQNCAPDLRKRLLEELQNFGWSGEVKIGTESGITITSMLNGVALCLQTGNMSRFYADLLKLQALYIKDSAQCAIYIIPTKKAASTMGSNMANYERLVDELSLFKHIITIPILVVGFEEE